MSWARLDDNFHDHRKVIGLDVAAVGLYTLCLTWAHRNARHGTERGVIPTTVPQRFAGTKAKRLAADLVAAGLWHETDSGWTIHDFEKYLPVEKTSAARSAAGKRGAAKRWANKTEKTAEHAQVDSNLPLASHDVDSKPIANDMANNGSRADAHRVVLRTTNPIPVPVPSLTGGAIAPATPGAQSLLAEWIDHCNAPPTARVKGQVAKELKSLLDEGVPFGDVRAGLSAWHDKRLNPSLISSVVHEVRQGPPTRGRTPLQSTTQARVNQAAEVADYFRRQDNPIAQKEIA